MSNRNIVLNSTISTSKNPIPDPTPITPIADNPATTTTKSPMPNNPIPIITNTTFIYNRNFTITSTTKNPILTNPTSTIIDTTFIYNTSNTTKNLTLPIPIITKATNTLLILSISTTTTNKTFSLLAKVTNLLSILNIDSNTIINNPMCIIGLIINNITSTIKLSNILTYNSLAALLAQNINTTLEQDNLLVLIYSKDAPFEFEDEILLNTNIPTIQGNTLASSASNEPLETPNNNTLQDNYLLVEPTLSISKEQLVKTNQD